MKILIFFRKPSSWLIIYLLVLTGFGFIYANSLGSPDPMGIDALTSSQQTGEKVSISVQGFGLDGLPAYLTLDSSNRRAIVGNIPIAGNVIDIEIVNEQIYVVTQRKGISVFNLSDPLSPVLDMKLQAERGWRSDYGENFLYISTYSNGLLIYPVPREKSPRRIAGTAISSIHRGNQVFVAGGNEGLSIYEFLYDSKWNDHSRLLGRLSLPGFTVDLSLLGNFLIAASRAGGLHLIDISDTEKPQLVQTISEQKIYERVWMVGDIVYASDRDRQLDLFSLTEGQLTLVGHLSLVGNVQDYLLDGERLYLTEASFGVSALDVSDPVRPRRIGFVGTPGRPKGLAQYEGHLYVASSSQGVQIIDKNRFEPLKVAASFDTSGNAFDLVLNGRWIYVADSEGGLQVIDRSERSNLKKVASFPTEYRALALAKAGNIIFVKLFGHGLILVDVSDPLKPSFVSQFRPDLSFSDLLVQGETLYASSVAGKLFKIDVSDPVSPQVVESIDLPGKPRRIAQIGNDIFIAAEKAGLLVVRFTPGAPGRHISSLTRPWPMLNFSQAKGIATRGKYAYLLQGVDGLQIVDISKAERPKEVEFIPLPDRGLSISISETYVVVSTRRSGYYFIDISRPDKPRLAANIYLPRSTGKFVIEDDYLYATSQTNGIYVVPLPIKNLKISSGPSAESFTFNQPQLPGWYDLSVSGGKTFVSAASVLEVE